VRRALLAILVASCSWWPAVRAAGPIEYRFTFPEPEHHWLQVEAVFPNLGPGPLDLRMSQTSPGRYAMHDFAKNVYDVRVFDAGGRELETTRPDPHGWRVTEHGGAVTVRYKVFGDRVDGTYLAIDTTHAHVNMPAVIMFGRGLDDRSARLTFSPPMSTPGWSLATQLIAGPAPFEFTAPNLQYLMDSPVELGPVTLEPFSVDGHIFRFAVHHTGTRDAVRSFVRDVEKIVREQRAIFGEFPAYESGQFTFLADYLPYSDFDGMEHRNSTVLTASTTIERDRLGLLSTVAHEFFHSWNVERIRPRALEPFNFEAANMTGELWLAEGFTQYYEPLTLNRAGLTDVASTASAFAEMIGAVALSPAHRLRSAEEMSRLAPFTDGVEVIDRTNWSTTYTSYYTFGGAIALALDLSLRERSDGRLSLDDFMRSMWRVYGKPGGSRPGYVDRPYDIADVEARLAEISGSAEFARTFVARYIQGHEVADYERLLAGSGLLMRRVRSGRAWIGHQEYARGKQGLQLMRASAPGTPAYNAGLDRGDEIVEIAGRAIEAEEQLAGVLRAARPGQVLEVTIRDRSGVARHTRMTLAEDPSFEIVPLEQTGAPLSKGQRDFRQRWLASHQ
jgi:predicted metalloprotease with PDZ domain